MAASMAMWTVDTIRRPGSSSPSDMGMRAAKIHVGSRARRRLAFRRPGSNSSADRNPGQPIRVRSWGPRSSEVEDCLDCTDQDESAEEPVGPWREKDAGED